MNAMTDLTRRRVTHSSRLQARCWACLSVARTRASRLRPTNWLQNVMQAPGGATGPARKGSARSIRG